MKNYNNDPNTRSYNAKIISDRLTKKYGQEYLDYRHLWEIADDAWVAKYPLNVVLDLTNQCNLACPQCYRTSKIRNCEFFSSKSELSKNQIHEIINDVHPPSINIGGSGECLLHPDIKDICKLVMDSGTMELRVITNGHLLTTDISKSLVDSQVHILSVSVDAFSPETYGLVRGVKEGYQKVHNNIMNFLSIKGNSDFPLLRVTFVDQPKNRHEKEDFIAYWIERADMVEIQKFHDFKVKKYNSDFRCTEPFKRLMVWADGRVGACCGFPGLELVVGNINKDSLSDIWAGEELRKLREHLLAATSFQKEYRIKHLKACLRCRGAIK